MPLIPALAGQKFTAASFNAALDNGQRIAYQASDAAPSNNSTTFQASAMSLSVIANASYTFDSFLVYDSTTVADFRFQFLLPTGGVCLLSGWASTTGAAAVDATIQHDVIILAATTSIVVAGAYSGSGFLNSCRATGAILTGANAGNVTVQYSQSTATAVNSVLKAGSWFRMSRVV